MLRLAKILKIIDQSTISAIVTSTVAHRKYHKIINTQKKVLVHVDNIDTSLLIPDSIVKIKSCKPISKNKHNILILDK